METQITKGLENDWAVEIWLTSCWHSFSKHRFKSDAELISNMLSRQARVTDDIREKVRELNKTSKNILI